MKYKVKKDIIRSIVIKSGGGFNVETKEVVIPAGTIIELEEIKE